MPKNPPLALSPRKRYGIFLLHFKDDFSPRKESIKVYSACFTGTQADWTTSSKTQSGFSLGERERAFLFPKRKVLSPILIFPTGTQADFAATSKIQSGFSLGEREKAFLFSKRKVLSPILVFPTGTQVDFVATGKIQNGFLGRGLGKPFFGHKEWFPQKISITSSIPRSPAGSG
ncbi:MAG: hypothetical protein E7336_06175 [Clostridiales bacterium]|nr:hypothetical protein [Clostridiales bacterium]